MKNFNILGIEKSNFQVGVRGGGSWKTNIKGGDYLKREAWTVYWFKGGLAKKEGGRVFEGGLRPQGTLCMKKAVYVLLVFFNQVPFLFLVYENIPFTCLRKKTFWFLRKINSFQNPNIFDHIFNLIINDSRLFNGNMRIGRYLYQAQGIM